MAAGSYSRPYSRGRSHDDCLTCRESYCSVRRPRSEFRNWRAVAFLNHPRAPWVLGLSLSILAAIQALHRARQGRGAFLRWEPDFAAFWSGADLYAAGAEGYPTLPVTLLVMSPFRELGPVPGAFAWALFKVGLAWLIVSRAFALVGAGERSLAPVAKVAIIALSFRPLLSDITHGNLNLLVGAVIASAAWSWQCKHELRAGLWMGLGAALKVTPALGLVYFIYKRSAAAGLGMALGLLGGVLAPSLAVGWEHNLDLTKSWWGQMIVPYLASNPLTLQQTEHINQSMLGVLSRWLTDCVAIPSSDGRTSADISINVIDLGRQSFRAVHLAASVCILAFLTWSCAPPGRSRRGLVTLGEFSLLALAMLFLSERSWKHHYVMLAFPLAFLVAQLQRPQGDPCRRMALVGIVLAGLLIGGTGSGSLGGHGSNLAEAYGAFFGAGLILFATVGLALRKRREAAGIEDSATPALE